MDRDKYLLELYTPKGDFAGLLDVYNLNVDLKIDDFSAISFDIAAYTDAEENLRLLDVLDLYEVVLEIKGKRYRFILNSIPAGFDDSGPRYSYQGLSTDSELEKKIITGWLGAKRTIEFFLLKYKSKAQNWIKDMPKLTPSLTNAYNLFQGKDKYEIADEIEIYEVRENETREIFKKTPLIQIDSKIGQQDNSLFKRGSYDLSIANSDLDFVFPKFSDIDIFEDHKEDSPVKNLMDQDLGVYYTIYLVPPLEFDGDDEAAKLLISDAAEKVDYKDMETYTPSSFNEEEYYTTEGVTLEEVLIDNLVNKTNRVWTYNVPQVNKDQHGNLIDPTFMKERRSGFNFNNITIYAMLEEVAKSFDIVYVVNTDERSVSFYKSYDKIKETTVNLITLEEGAYLKAIEKNLDLNNIATNIYGLGKDYISTSLVSPGGAGWEDYSYYLDGYWREIQGEEYYPALTNKEVLNAYRDDLFLYRANNLKSRWMSKGLAAQISSWQKVRDIMAEVFLGDYDFQPEGDQKLQELKDAYNIVEKRDFALKELVRIETKYININTRALQYESLVNFVDKDRATLREGEEDKRTERQKRAQEDWERFNEIAEASRETADELLEEVKEKELELETLDAIFMKNKENLRDYLEELGFEAVHEAELQKFKFDYFLQDNTVDTLKVLLEKTREYAEENSKPKVSLRVDIIDILAAYDVPEEDKENLFVGNYLFINFPMFNIDEKVQIKGMSIDFDANSTSLEVSNVERYTKGLLHKIVENIRALGIEHKNVSKYEFDDVQSIKGITKETKEKIDLGDITIGSKEGVNVISPYGLESGTAGINYNTDELEIIPDKQIDKVNIGGGAVFLEREITGESEEEQYHKGSQVILSVEEGFKINKIEWHKGQEGVDFDKKYIENLFSINKDGDINMKGIIEAKEGKIGGWTIGEGRLYANKKTYSDLNIIRRGLSAGIIYIKEVFDFDHFLSKDNIGNIKVTIAEDIALNKGVLKSGYTLEKIGEAYELFNFSKGIYFTINFSTQQVLLSMEPEEASGFSIDLIDGVLESEGYVELDAANNIILAGDKTIGEAPFSVDMYGKMRATGAEISGNITATEGLIGGWSIGDGRIFQGAGSSYVGIHSSDQGNEKPAFIAGGTTWNSSKFAVDHKGNVRMVDAIVSGEISVDDFKAGKGGVMIGEHEGDYINFQPAIGGGNGSSLDIYINKKNLVEMVFQLYNEVFGTGNWEWEFYSGAQSPVGTVDKYSLLPDPSIKQGAVYAVKTKISKQEDETYHIPARPSIGDTRIYPDGNYTIKGFFPKIMIADGTESGIQMYTLFLEKDGPLEHYRSVQK